MNTTPQFRLMQRAMDQIDVRRLEQNATREDRSLVEVVAEAYAQQGLEVDAGLIADTCRVLEAEAARPQRWWHSIRQEGVMAFYDACAVTLLAVFGVALGWTGLETLVEPLLSSPKFSSALLVTGGVVVALQLVMGTISTASEDFYTNETHVRWASWWIPVRTALGAIAVIPFTPEGSLLTRGLLACVRWGAYWVS